MDISTKHLNDLIGTIDKFFEKREGMTHIDFDYSTGPNNYYSLLVEGGQNRYVKVAGLSREAAHTITAVTSHMYDVTMYKHDTNGEKEVPYTDDGLGFMGLGFFVK